jgi:hypothetical protein
MQYSPKHRWRKPGTQCYVLQEIADVSAGHCHHLEQNFYHRPNFSHNYIPLCMGCDVAIVI